MPEPYYNIRQIISKFMDINTGNTCLKILNDNISLFDIAQGSSHNHQAWEGGYIDHVTEVLNEAIYLYDNHNKRRKLPFVLNDALLILFLHDIEKPWRHILKIGNKEEREQFRLLTIAKYGIRLDNDQSNALKYVEGEGKDYSSSQRIMGPLAAFCHMCDVASARLWPEHPLAKDDPWIGANRCNGEINDQKENS